MSECLSDFYVFAIGMIPLLLVIFIAIGMTVVTAIKCWNGDIPPYEPKR